MKKKTFNPSFFQHVFDASSLINIEAKNKIGDLRKRIDEIVIPQKVAYEIDLPHTPLAGLIKRYPEVVAQFRDDEETEYLRIRSQPGIHDGEASAITIALKRNLPLVIDDRKGKQKAENHGIKTLDWTAFLNL
jgi:predicted nucleic acid-binding protein